MRFYSDDNKVWLPEPLGVLQIIYHLFRVSTTENKNSSTTADSSQAKIDSDNEEEPTDQKRAGMQHEDFPGSPILVLRSIASLTQQRRGRHVDIAAYFTPPSLTAADDDDDIAAYFTPPSPVAADADAAEIDPTSR
nr:hypothetical protein Iba_scaffold587CG0120 [Ipomoea batatas]